MSNTSAKVINLADRRAKKEDEARNAPINGWIRDRIKNCYYVPCAPTPTGYFDQLEFYHYHEAEL